MLTKQQNHYQHTLKPTQKLRYHIPKTKMQLLPNLQIDVLLIL